MTAPHPRAGFSVVEALVVLAITTTLLILLFSVSSTGTRAGFRTATRAGDAADRAVGTEALRTLIRAIRLPRSGSSAVPFAGDADGFDAAAAPVRPTPCAPAAPTLDLRLRLDRSGGRTRLVCATPRAPALVLLDLGPSAASFSYALAGRPWSAALVAGLPPARGAGGSPSVSPSPRLWVRLATADGRLELVEAVDLPDAPARAGA